jgi:hypothetical protein
MFRYGVSISEKLFMTMQCEVYISRGNSANVDPLFFSLSLIVCLNFCQ